MKSIEICRKIKFGPFQILSRSEASLQEAFSSYRKTEPETSNFVPECWTFLAVFGLLKRNACLYCTGTSPFVKPFLGDFSEILHG